MLNLAAKEFANLLTYEGGVRVPMIARWSGKIKPGQVNHQPFCALGLPPDSKRNCRD